MSEGSSKEVGADRDAEVTRRRRPRRAGRRPPPTPPTGPPTPEEEAAAEGKTLDPEVAEHEREMGKIGAEVKGEGEID